MSREEKRDLLFAVAIVAAEDRIAWSRAVAPALTVGVRDDWLW
jgi:hypothetical protein